MPTRDLNTNTKRMEERNSSAEARADVKTAGNMAGGGDLAAASRAKAAGPKLPRRSEFSDDATYSKAYKSYMDSRNSDAGAVAQKRALERMGK